MSNQRQIAMAISMYADENNGMFLSDDPPALWTTPLASYGDPKLYRCPNGNGHGSLATPDYGVNRFALGVVLDTIKDPSATPLTMDIDPSTVQPNFLVQNLQTDIAVRHTNGAIVSFVDGHVQWCGVYSHATRGVVDPFVDGDIDLLAACPLVYEADGPFSATVNNAAYLAEGGTAGLWPRFQIELPPMSEGGFKTGGVMPNIMMQYDVVSTTGIQESPAVAVGIMKPQNVRMADNGARGVDFLPGLTFAAITHDANSFNSGLGTWLFDGTWQRPGVGETLDIPRSDFGQFMTNIHMRGTLVGQQGVGTLLGSKSHTGYSVFLDQSTTPTGWNSIPDDQLGVYFFGWCSPWEDNTVTIQNVIVRLLPSWTPALTH